MAKRKRKKTLKKASAEPVKPGSAQEIIEKVKKAFSEQLDSGKIKLKVGDIVKILELQQKLSTDSSAEEKFWEFIEQIRQTELEEDEE